MRASRLWVTTVLCLIAGMVTIPAQAAATQIAKYDFENGTTQGWGPRGPVTVTATSDAAHSGTQSLLTTGGRDNWNAPSIAPPFEKGVTYQVSPFVRLVAGQPSSTVAMTVQRTPAG